MKADELRIGNYIQIKEPKEEYIGVHLEVIEITSYLSQNIQCMTPNCISFYCSKTEQNTYNFETDYFEPIPLTEEWLLKFDFSKSPFDKTSLQYKKDIYSLIGNEENWFCLSVGNFVHTKVRIQYLHQLQNLYFALTGEELTIKGVTNDSKRKGRWVSKGNVQGSF